jgi:hypothetical protein
MGRLPFGLTSHEDRVRDRASVVESLIKIGIMLGANPFLRPCRVIEDGVLDCAHQIADGEWIMAGETIDRVIHHLHEDMTMAQTNYVSVLSEDMEASLN